jgi:hypothetical protein
MDPTRRKSLLIALGVFVFALIVRLIGLGWGLPGDQRNFSLHPDEPVVFLYSQQIEPAKFDFTPGFYNYGTLYLTLLRVSTDVAEAYGAGPTDNSGDAAYQAIGRFTKVGRVLSALAGAATALLVLLILLPRIGEVGAVAGAIAMALAPGHVVHSRFQTVDVLATCFLAASLYFALRPLKEGESYTRLAVWSGVFAGLSAGTKYTGILALLVLAVMVLVEKRGWKPMLVGVGCALAVFVLVTPGVVTDSSAFMRDFKYEMTHTQTGHGLVFAGTPSGFVEHVKNLFVALGFFASLLGLIGIGRAAYRRHAWAIALLVFALAYYVLIGRAEVKFMRYVFPLLPVLAVGFGWLLGRAVFALKSGAQGGVMARSGGVALIAVLGIASSASTTALYTAWMAGTDPRDTVAQDLRQDVTVGLVQDPWFYTPSFYKNSASGPFVPFEKRKEWMDAAMNPRVVRYVPVEGERVDFDKRLLTELSPDYVVLSSFEVGDINRLLKLPSPPPEFITQIGRAEEFMDTLQTGYERWKVRGQDGTYLPHDMMYIRPIIEVWKRKTGSETTSSGSSTTSAPSGGPAPTP